VQQKKGHTAHQVDPRAHAHLLARLHHLECLVQQDLTGQSVVNHLDYAVCEREPPARRVFLHAYSAAESEFDDDAAAERVGDVLVPERQVALIH
jgi:hypothetical protein